MQGPLRRRYNRHADISTVFLPSAAGWCQSAMVQLGVLDLDRFYGSAWHCLGGIYDFCLQVRFFLMLGSSS